MGMQAKDITKVAITSAKVVINFDGDRQQAPVTYKDRPLQSFTDCYELFKNYFQKMSQLEVGSDSIEVNFVLRKTSKQMDDSFMIGVRRSTDFGNHNIQTPLVPEDSCPQDIVELFKELQKEAMNFHNGKRQQMQLFGENKEKEAEEA